ncbi:MAG: FixH family protein [Sulfitobacter sp.]|nr:FixH family protein [Sulfitobacter sp.]
MTEIKGWHVLSIFVLAFGTIITVNLTLAFNAVRTFPGLEVKNTYIASQVFDKERLAQEALGWDVTARAEGDEVLLSIQQAGRAIAPTIENATFGRATSVDKDRQLDFRFDGQVLRAPMGEHVRGNYNLRLRARAEDGTLYQRRLVVRVAG